MNLPPISILDDYILHKLVVRCYEQRLSLARASLESVLSCRFASNDLTKQ